MTVHVPFTGDPMLLRLRPSRWSFVLPQAEIGAGELLLQITGPHLSSEQVTASFNNFRTSITQYLDATNADVREHYARLDVELRRVIAARRSRLLEQRQLAAGLPFQLRPALVLFIKRGNPTEVLRKADRMVDDHPQCVRRFDPADATVRIDYLLRSTADPERTVRTALLPVAIAPPPARSPNCPFGTLRL